MNIPDHISESLETVFWAEILKFFAADPNPGIFQTLDPGSGNLFDPESGRDKHPGSATLLEVVPEELRLGDAGIADKEDVDVAPEPGPVIQVLLHAAQQHAQQGLTSN